MQVFLKPLTPTPRSPEKPPGQGTCKARPGCCVKSRQGGAWGGTCAAGAPSLTGFSAGPLQGGWPTAQPSAQSLPSPVAATGGEFSHQGGPGPSGAALPGWSARIQSRPVAGRGRPCQAGPGLRRPMGQLPTAGLGGCRRVCPGRGVCQWHGMWSCEDVCVCVLGVQPPSHTPNILPNFLGTPRGEFSTVVLFIP